MPPSDLDLLQRVRSASPQDLQSLVGLEVSSADPGTEVFIIDAQFRVVERGRETVQANLTPGIYKIKVKAGNRIHEEFVMLAPGQSGQKVEIGPLQIASAAPLESTARTDAPQRQSALRESLTHHAHLGKGSSLFFFVRDWESAVLSNPNAPSFLLCDLQGNVLLDLGQGGVQGGESRRWAACNVSVGPGVYRLQHNSGTCIVEQTLVASPGWQTQLFAACKRREESSAPEINLADSSIFMKREGVGFHPADPEQRLIELARQGLAQGRMVLPERIVMHILDAKFEDPMLGIYGAHILLAQNAGPVDLGVVVANLRNLLVDPHPDVESLALQLSDRGSSYRFEVPPMLRRSWALIVNATLRHPGLIPRGSLADKITSRVLESEPWLLTGLNHRESVETASSEADVELEAAVKGFLQEVTMPRRMRRRKIAPSLPRAARSPALESMPASESAGGRQAWWNAKLSESTIAQLVNNLGVSRDKLESVLDRLTSTKGALTHDVAEASISGPPQASTPDPPAGAGHREQH